MTNFDYISEQIKAGEMNAEQMEEFIHNGTFEKFACECSICRKTFLELSYVSPIIDIPIFDKETRIENCTVQILENTKTGRVSIGWWKNDEG